jgi:hypothetical protein
MKLDEIEKLIAGCGETLENYDREYTEGMEHQRGYSYAKIMYNELCDAQSVLIELKNLAKDEDGFDISAGLPVVVLLPDRPPNDASPRWIRFLDEKPKIGERVLVLIDGEIHEGYLDEVDLWKSGHTVFQTVFTIPSDSLSSAQHWSWGYDPYWMPIPCEKPEQLKMPKGQIFCELMK